MSFIDVSEYTAKNAGQAWSLTEPSSDTFRFEVRDNDFARDTAGNLGTSERSDMTVGSPIAMGTPLHLNFDLTVENGSANTAGYLVLGSFSSIMADGTTANVPAFDIDLIGEQVIAYIRFTDASGAIATRQLYLDTQNIQRGESYNFDVSAVFDPAGNGRLVLSRDGVVVADYSGPLGYAGQQSVVWTQGINRSAEATETTAVEFGHLKLEAGEGVAMPAATTFLQAPNLGVKNVSPVDGSDDLFAAHMFGTAVSHSTVTIYADGKVAGSVVADASGNYDLTVDVSGQGAHRLVAVTSDGSGVHGTSSYPASFTIGTANDPGATQGNTFFLLMDGETYWLENANKSWSISSPEPDMLRFEVRDRDVFWFDLKHGSTSERSEVRSEIEIANKTAAEVSFQVNLEPGAKNDAYFLLLGQFHQDDYPNAEPWSPPFALAMEGERMILDVRYSGADGQPVTQRIFTDVADIQRGRFYDIDIKAVFDPSGESGRIIVTRDGVILADYTGPLGFTEQNGVYWKNGIYRHNNATEPLVVDFKGLKITTGETVALPGKDVFIGAPTVSSTKIGYEADAGQNVVHMTGSAKAGTSVAIFEGDVQVATAVADQNGVFNASWAIDSTGRHAFHAIATDETGRSGITSGDFVVRMGTAAEFVAAVPTLAKETGLVAFVLTDTKFLPVTSHAQIDTMLKGGADALAKIQGTFLFQLTTTVKNQGYDKQVETYDSAGNAIERARYSGTKMVYDETIGADGTRVIKTFAADGATDINTYSGSGALLETNRVNAAGVLYQKGTLDPDGTRTIHNYNADTGIETGYTVTSPNGQKQVVQLNIANRAYTSQATTYDASNKVVAQERFNADGVSLFKQTWASDGSYSIRTGNIQDQPYASKIVLYSAANKVTGTDTYDASTHLLSSERIGADGSRKVFLVENGSKIGFTQTYVDGSKLVASFVSDHPELLLRADLFDASGTLVKTSFFDASGALVATDAPIAGGGHVQTQFDPKTGFPLSATTYAADDSKAVTTYSTTTSGQIVGVSHQDASGKIVGTETFDGAGHKISDETRGADGVLVRSFDIGTGLATGFVLTKADGSKSVGTYAAGSGDKIAAVDTFNKAGKLTASVSYGADGSTKTYAVDASGQKVGATVTIADGSSTVLKFVAGHEELPVFAKKYAADGSLFEVDNFNSAGKLARVDAWKTDGSRETHYFDVATGKETSFVVKYANNYRLEANLAVTGKDYAQQFLTYDASGKMVEGVRKYGDANATVAFTTKILADGSSETHQYDVSGRETTKLFGYVDGSRDLFKFAYSDTAGAHPTSQIASAKVASTAAVTTITHEHFGSSGIRQWVDVEKPDGTHMQTAVGKGAVMTSHLGVEDVFTGLRSSKDTFIFDPSFGKDTVKGFEVAGAAHDVIEFSDAVVSDYAHLAALMKQAGADTVITLSDSDVLTLKNVAMTSLSEDHFRFAHHDVLQV